METKREPKNITNQFKNNAKLKCEKLEKASKPEKAWGGHRTIQFKRLPTKHCRKTTSKKTNFGIF